VLVVGPAQTWSAAVSESLSQNVVGRHLGAEAFPGLARFAPYPSSPSTLTGSTRTARLAGSHAARSAVAPSTTVTQT
jgi:hypothetical protein